MSKFIIIVYIFINVIFLFGCTADEHICENNVMGNNLTEEQIIENQSSINIDIQEGKITKETTKEETINKSENVKEDLTTKQKNGTVNTPLTTEKTVVKKEETRTDTAVPNVETKAIENITPTENTLETTPTLEELEIPKKNGYYYNEGKTKFLVSEFYRLTNNNPNFTVKPDPKAKKSNPFWGYKESEITKQIENISFGDFIVYAEDYYKDDIIQRTLYYICFNV